jgi:hypothetical protein
VQVNRRGDHGYPKLEALILLLSWGCKLDRQQDPNLQGPSDAGVSVDLTAAPDTVNADGVSTSLVTLTLRNNLGEPLVDWPVLFQHDGDGKMLPAPGARYVGPVQTGEVMATDGDGRTAVVYRAGRGIRFVTVGVRPYATDTDHTSFYRYVEIVQQ